MNFTGAAVSVQVVFLSNPYEVNNTEFCINSIYTGYDAYFTSEVISFVNFLLLGVGVHVCVNVAYTPDRQFTVHRNLTTSYTRNNYYSIQRISPSSIYNSAF